MKTIIRSIITSCLAILFLLNYSTQGEQGPLPEFTFKGVALHPDDLSYAPGKDFEHPTVIKMEGRVENPLGRYYLYYAPHKHVGIGVVYSDSLAGPWKEYEGNPVLEGPAAPDIRWIEEKGKFYLWGHRTNSQTECWTSDDGIHFEYQGVSITGGNIGTKNASYTRVYEYPLNEYGSKYIMLYSGLIQERGIRCVWLAHSRDAENWTQLKTPLVEPVEGENDNIYGPALLQFGNRNFIVYQDQTAWRGGNIKYVEVDSELNPVDNKGKRFVLMDPPSEPPLDDRYRGGEFYRENDTIYLISGASKSPRILVYATAEVKGAIPTREPLPKKIIGGTKSVAEPKGAITKQESLPKKVKGKTKPKKEKGKTKKNNAISEGKKQVAPGESASLDDILKSVKLETVYETTFEEPLRMIHESDLIEDGKTIAREPSKDIDWVLEGPAEVYVKSGRMHIRNNPDGNCVLWNTREFPESFVAEWDFQHLHPQGTAIFFFAAHAENGGSIFRPGLPRRGGNFGNYTKGRIFSYHTSYSATDEKGVPRESAHLKKNGGVKNKGKGNNKGISPIDGKTDRPYRIRLAKLGARIIIEIDGQISIDWTDGDEKGGGFFTSGQIGFRQMAHTLEASYGGLRIQRVKTAD